MKAVLKYHFIALSLFMVISSVGKAQSQTHKLFGKVVSEHDDEPLIGAIVYVAETNIGVVVDYDGNYELRLDGIENIDTITVTFSFVGYEKQAFDKLKFRSDNVRLDVKLKEFPYGFIGPWIDSRQYDYNPMSGRSNQTDF